MKKVVFFAAAIVSILAAADTNKDFIKERKRLINREIVGTNVVYTYARGTKIWCETNALKCVSVRVGPVRYSKLKLIVAAKAAGKWDDVKAAIAAMDLEDEWNACQYITSDYPAYVAATNAVITQGIATPEMVQAFMKLAEDN